MADIFIAYTKSDCYFVKSLSEKIEENHISTWYYERDKSLFNDPITTSRKEIDKCHAFLVVISDLITPNNFIDAELKYASTKGKRLIVILSNLTEEELEKKFPDWTYILFAKTTCTQIPKTKTDKYINKIIENLKDYKSSETDPKSNNKKSSQHSGLNKKLKRFYEFLLTRNDLFYYILLLVLFTISFVFFVIVIAK